MINLSLLSARITTKVRLNMQKFPLRTLEILVENVLAVFAEKIQGLFS